jgi:hypothetical protein
VTYIEKLNPWCIVRHFPSMQHQIVARFRRRSDAEAIRQSSNQSKLAHDLVILKVKLICSEFSYLLKHTISPLVTFFQ